VDRAALERIRDWNEFHHHMEEDKLRKQGARCMDCGVPFCHTGKLLNGAASGCPINNLIPEWNDLIYRGLWHEALDRLHRTNNFLSSRAEFVPLPARVVRLGITDPPVTIKNIETRSSIAGGGRLGRAEAPASRTGKRVAVIGSGPLAFRGGAAQPGRTLGQRLRAGRPTGRTAHVRDPEHEARQTRWSRAGSGSCRRRGSSSFATPTSAIMSSPDIFEGIRRDRDLHGRHPARRPAGRWPQA